MNRLVTIFPAHKVALSEELRTWAMGEVEAISCMAYPRERSFQVELSPDKSLPYDLEIIEVDTYTIKSLLHKW